MGLELNHFSKDLRPISHVLKHVVITGWSKSFFFFLRRFVFNFLSIYPILVWILFSSGLFFQDFGKELPDI